MKNKLPGNEMSEREITLKQQLRRSLHQNPAAADPAQLRVTTLLSRQELCRKQKRQRISFPCFLRKQLPLIGWKLWCAQCLLFLAAYGILSDFPDYLTSPLHLAKALFCLSIAVFMTALPLLYRSVRFRMQEIEGTTRFSTTKLLLARLIVIAIGDFALLCGIFLAVLGKTSLSADSAVIYLCFPFLLAGSGCLFMLGHFPPGRFLAGSILFCSALILLCSVLPGQYAFLLHSSFFVELYILCALLFVFCAYQLRFIIKASDYTEMQIT